MKFDINQVLKQMLDAIAGTAKNDLPILKETGKIFLISRKERLGQLATFHISGAIDEEFFKNRLEDEKLLLESELHALKIMTMATAQRAANAAIEVFSKAVLSAIVF